MCEDSPAKAKVKIYDPRISRTGKRKTVSQTNCLGTHRKSKGDVTGRFLNIMRLRIPKDDTTVVAI